MRSALLTGCLWMLSAATYAQFNDRVPSGTPLRWGMQGGVEIMPGDLAYQYGRTDTATAYRRNISVGANAVTGNPTATRFATVRTQCTDNALVFNWVAVQQGGADRYEVEQSADGRRWRVVGVVPASTHEVGETSYSFTYNKEVRDALFRISAINSAGERVHSPAVETPCNPNAALAVTPNPVYSTTTVRIGSPASTKVSLVVVDARGVAVQAKETGLMPGVNDIRLDMSSLISGAYMLVIHWPNGKEQTLQLMKQ